MSLFIFDKLTFTYLILLIFIFGACLGSFSNVIILRAFSGESIVLPPSKCPKCMNKLKWYHNIPIFSYLFLRGKCGFCGKPISIQYPLVEATIACLFVAIFLKFGISLKSLFLSLASMMCVILSVTDIKEKVIFDGHAYILAILGLIYNFFNFGNVAGEMLKFNWFGWNFAVQPTFLDALWGILVAIIAMELLAATGRIFVGERAFGEGDTYILAGVGAIFGYKSILFILIASFLIQVVMILPMLIKKLITNKDYALIGGLSAFALMVGFFKIAETLGWLKNIIALIVMFVLLIGIAIYTCRLLIKSMKSQDGLTFVPFGPAIVIAAFIYMFIHY